jgi:alkaline phosphatase D
MKLLCFAALFAGLAVVAAQEELPITTTDVFVQSGEVSDSSAIIMARCNQEVDSKASLNLDGTTVPVERLSSPVLKELQALEATDYTVSFLVEGLESNQKYTYSVACSALDDTMPAATSMSASFKTLPGPEDAAPLNFVWAADLAGQGWGRNPEFEITTVGGATVQGGYCVFDTMSSLEPDFALFQGDMIYADGAIPSVKAIPDAMGGGNWTNNPSKDFVAVTLEDFRANWKYNHGDDKMQNFLGKTPVFVQWDDHEVTNNWWPDEVLGGDKYPEGTAANTLSANSLQAFYEFNPILEGTKIDRKQRFGKHVEIFFPDFRSYRDPNPGNSDPEGIAMMGPEQLEWLKQSLLESTATWKIISAHDPLGIVTGGEGDRDSFGQEQAEILGRELEVKDLLGFIHSNDIPGVVSLTSDVHFTAHVSMHPDRAEGGFTDFKPLDEFCIGPIHAGSFGPNFIDSSFGAKYEYEMGPLTAGFERWANLPPSQSNLQSFGHAAVTEDGNLEIKLISITGEVMWEKSLTPGKKDETKPAGGESAAFGRKGLSIGAVAFTFILSLLV